MAPSDLDVYEAALAGNESDRLRAARKIRLAPDSGFLNVLLRARARENVHWIRTALDEAIAACEKLGQPSSAEDSTATEDDVDASQAYADGRRDGLRQTLHELAPLVGLARAAAEEQDNSEVARQLERLRAACAGLRGFVTASSPREFGEFDLSSIPHSLAAAPPIDCPANVVNARGVSPLWVRGDKDLLELALRPIVTNAIEAALELSKDPSPNSVTISWGLEGRLCWIVVIDRGPGLNRSRDLVLAGSSTKPGHLGFGLATATTAMTSLGGRVEIDGNSHGGTTVLLEWQGAI